MDNYEFVKKLGSGNFGVINLMRHKQTGEMVAVKRLEVRAAPVLPAASAQAMQTSDSIVLQWSSVRAIIQTCCAEGAEN